MSSTLFNAATKKVFIQVETAAEQQENIKNQRKTLKVLQNVATDKENLTGRAQIDKLSRIKAAVKETILSTNIENGKPKKMENKAAETETSSDLKSSVKQQIAAEDLCGEAPGEHYWERLAENRRVALEQTLEENRSLYERIDGLQEELNTSRQQLEEVKHLVSVLNEMLNEDECEQEIGQKEAETEGVAELTQDEDVESQSDDGTSCTSKANKETRL